MKWFIRLAICLFAGVAFCQAPSQQHITEKKRLWQQHQIKDIHGLFSGYRYRKFGNEVIDMWPVIEIEYDLIVAERERNSVREKYAALISSQYKKRELGADFAKRRMKAEVDKANSRIEKLKQDQLGSPYLNLWGKVIQVVPDGLLLSDSILVNYPDASVVDGSWVSCLARYGGIHRYTTVLGASRTIRKYDFGVPLSLEEYTAEKALLRETASNQGGESALRDAGR